jgi:protein-L-isoaspartate(D-aspartate) O-methyltransferase
MAWRSSGATNKALIENLERNGLIKSQRVKDAMLQVLPSHTCPPCSAMPLHHSPTHLTPPQHPPNI